MKFLITQVVDAEHPILRFFHRWTEEAKKQSSIPSPASINTQVQISLSHTHLFCDLFMPKGHIIYAILA